MFTNMLVRVGSRQSGLAGGFCYSATVNYVDSDTGLSGQYSGLFHGSVYGGPIFVDGRVVDSVVCDRIGGGLTPDWIRSFYSA